MQKKIIYPTGVENHGGFLRIWFMYQNERFRESLGIPDTPKNRKMASEMRQSIVYSIKTGSFDYARQFPESPNAHRFATNSTRELSVKALFDRWLELKQPELSLNTLRRYKVKLETCGRILGQSRMISSLTSEDIFAMRNELLTGHHRPARNKKVIPVGRTVSTVNDYVICMKGAVKFAVESGYLKEDPTTSVSKLKRARVRPDPLSRDEFTRFISACLNDQTANIWTIAVYTGLRHGELCALAWEDIDLEAGTLTVRRNWTSVKQYTLPKTEAGTDRTIFLMEPAKEALRKQQALTRLKPTSKVKVLMREHGKSRTDLCTFVFDPKINAKGNRAGERFTPTALADSWDRAVKRAKLRHRNAYQSRHTFACWSLSAGANPAFIAMQMGHTSAQMLFSVYGDWMPDHNADQLALLNAKLGSNAPYMPHTKSGTS